MHDNAPNALLCRFSIAWEDQYCLRDGIQTSSQDRGRSVWNNLHSRWADLIVEDLHFEGLESNSVDREFSKLATTPHNKVPKITSVQQILPYSLGCHESHIQDLECSLETAYKEMIASSDSGTALHAMSNNNTKIEGIITHHWVLAAEKCIMKIEYFHDEIRSEIEKAKYEKMKEDLAAKPLTSWSKLQHQTVALPLSAGPSKFPWFYGDSDSELSDLPESTICASPSPPWKLPPRAAQKTHK
ncbi:hypothetical protein DEU56DRAFT_754113 [Suillus clintonianus]|uniref:uncharacterized protein n=1 Tax=Suillus clintonianus TaxID=1904413 RepID=UPI001B86AAD7|nr:uncharacterized protein DEU56DRAFT_754113 [Suillus clintonianus]KAG2145255.1 hypothetical protein DEU56DRAFT_754113 [Suillus clintonianus]